MNTIKINNDYCYLLTTDDKLKSNLWNALRYRTRDYFHSTLYRSGKWDGYIDFFSKKTGKFLTGLLPEVKLALNHWKEECKIVDLRKAVNFAHKQIDEKFLKSITLEDYQVEFINQAIKYKRGVVQGPCGSGKTYIMMGIMKALPPNTPILFLGNRKTIIRQNYKEIMKWGFKNVGMFDGNHHDPNVITCATVQSLHHIDKLLPKFKALIVDEVHLMMSNTCIKAYKKLKDCNVRIALSATPFKHGETDKVHKYSVKGFFGPVFKTQVTESGKLTTNELQERGRLSGSDCTFFPIDHPQIPYHIYLDAVTEGIAQNWDFHKVVSRLAKSLKGRTLILVERLAHGDALANLIPNSLWIQGKDNDETRDNVIAQLQGGKKDTIAIATIGIFSVGVNVFVHNFINAAGGKAEHDVIQRMGRGLRPADDKELLHYYDFIFRINQYLESHSNKRIKILRKEKHKVTIKDNIDF